MAKSENHWETIIRNDSERTERLTVPGGWIYRSIHIPWSENEPVQTAMVFVPNPKPGTKTA